jgi:hypothetical protein
MASVSGSAPGVSSARSAARADEGSGWVSFAGVMLAIVGTMNFIYGIAAIGDSRFFANDTTYIIHDLNVYGWVLLVVGIIQIATAFGIWSGAEWARWVGVFSASVNAVIQLTWLAAAPLAALALFAIDLLVIYGLVAHGGRRRAAA